MTARQPPKAGTPDWWLWRAQLAEENFLSITQEHHQRWAPGGQEHKWRAVRRYQNQLIADYYAKQGERPVGNQVTVKQAEAPPQEQQPENTKKLNHPDYVAMKRKSKVKRRKRSAVARKARRRIRQR